MSETDDKKGNMFIFPGLAKPAPENASGTIDKTTGDLGRPREVTNT